MNQCDGCRRGIPVENGKHYLIGIGNYLGEIMLCTKHRYTPSFVLCAMSDELDEEFGQN